MSHRPHAAQHKPHTFKQNIKIASLFLSAFTSPWFRPIFSARMICRSVFSSFHTFTERETFSWTMDKVTKKKLNYSDELISIPMLSRSAATNVGLLLLNGCPSGGQQVRLRACDGMAQVLNWNVKWRINFGYGTKCSRLFRKIRVFFRVARAQMFLHEPIENIRTDTNWNEQWKKFCQFVVHSFMSKYHMTNYCVLPLENS